jgi:hypothetical protein
MLAVDFFHVDCVVTPRRIYAQFATEVRSRYVHILGPTTNSQFSAYGGLFEPHRVRVWLPFGSHSGCSAPAAADPDGEQFQGRAGCLAFVHLT